MDGLGARERKRGRVFDEEEALRTDVPYRFLSVFCTCHVSRLFRQLEGRSLPASPYGKRKRITFAVSACVSLVTRRRLALAQLGSR